MSIHLVECAAEQDLPPAWKWVLAAFADSADRSTGIAYPGLSRVRKWSGLSRSRTFEVVNELEELGLLRKHRGGGNGKRAEYVVFPNGCCEQHQRPKDDVDDDIEAGSDPPDPVSGRKSDPPDPAANTHQGPTGRTRSVRPTGPAGSDESPTHRTPSLTPTTKPLTPTTAGTCPAHPDRPAANCRSCGTNARHIAERDEAEQRRRDSDAAIQADRRRKAETADVDAAAHAAEARKLLHKTGATRG